MKVTIGSKKLEKIINNEKKLIKKYGVENARLIIKRLDQLKAADSLGIMVKFRIGRCHSLSSNFKGKFALDLDHPDRLIIEPVFEDNIDLSQINYFDIKEIVVLEVKDYHGK
ncbi:hypothetical protein NZ45_12335 [Clostridium botulinum]|uniref:Plasmid maintenance system killer protein n=1 Tax=Clostridium botulinum TaxID=1491 RepID=A0ABD7CMD4_CLOBO|nr:hypothetical protein [Clostridium botulinum]KGO13444.1 hypothetical protein NZ45_12335 [Clostridium botulinum]QRI52242.1 plasmid maintenance system killer protein [Clostridium botulinum]QRI54096.1 plasmid maintenance system killer protein [Clostridium botulinum]